MNLLALLFRGDYLAQLVVARTYINVEVTVF